MPDIAELLVESSLLDRSKVNVLIEVKVLCHPSSKFRQWNHYSQFANVFRHKPWISMKQNAMDYASVSQSGVCVPLGTWLVCFGNHTENCYIRNGSEAFTVKSSDIHNCILYVFTDFSIESINWHHMIPKLVKHPSSLVFAMNASFTSYGIITLQSNAFTEKRSDGKIHEYDD